MSKLWRLAPLAAAAAVTLGISACGSSSNNKSTSSPTTTAKTGGTLTVLDVAGGVDSLDPGYWYYQTDYSDLWQPTQRSLYGWPDNDITSPVPDLATALPTATDGGKTLTIHIKPGIKYSPPLQNQAVSAADIKYALNRCLTPKIGNGYAGAYFTSIVGAPAMLAGKATSAPGIQAPNPTTLVLKLTTPQPVLSTAQALSLPCTVPVPQSYAAKYDKGASSTYGMHQVFTGPYMIKGAETGTVPGTGYTPNKILDLVRNPSFSQATDPIITPHFNEIQIKEGYTTDVASRDILNGSGMVSGDFAAPPPDIAAQYLKSKPSQFHVQASQSLRYIGMNPHSKPFGNIDVRKAIIAVTNRTALILTRGGPYIGIPATHWIPPGMPGYDQAGGAAGPGYDFYANPNGNLALAESYMKKAGYPSGKYSGPPLLMVADNASPAKETAEAFATQIAQIGFKVNLEEVPHATMYSKFCEVPKNQPPLCPNLAWGKDFFDSQSMIAPLFYGPNIAQSGNTNTAQLNNPAVNAAIAKADLLTDPTARAAAFGAIDKMVTAGAYYDTWTWDKEANLRSSNVNANYNDFNTDWDLATSSLQ
ncbi:MAG TPA: ABC transporter substrate-binding protein [Solirubrobacteraceae bacterium]|jgi:peptide/nickel transport system substrate-binding protein|nr:ABC transporter substrate-binding protein [Solirubrobacteraceae bacterium]